MWIDPAAGEVMLSDYSAQWLADRPNLRPRSQGCTAACSAAHPADAGRGRAGGDHAGQGPLLAGLINAGHPGASTISKVVPAPPRHLRHGPRGRPDRPETRA